MTTNAAVRTEWKTDVWGNINGGKNAYDYELVESQESEVAKAYLDGKIDFWVYIVASTKIPITTGQYEERFQVIVRHWVQQKDDVDGANYKQLIDDFRTMNDFVQTNLGESWNNTVQTFDGPGIPTPSLVNFANIPCWFAEVVYNATNLVNT